MTNLIPVVFALFCLLNCAWCRFYGSEDETIKECGDHLAKEVSAICKGQFATVKRAYRGPVNSESLKNLDGVDIHSELPFPLQNPWKSTSFIPSRFRRYTGIVDECCRKPCSLYELQSYCF